MAKKNIKLSVAIAVFNEEKNLEECLASVHGLADEIIVVDGGSGDATVSIARKFTSHIIETDNPAMFHINKQKALNACSGSWILQLDADERVTPALRNEILTVINQQPGTNNQELINGYFIPRRNYFWGHFMRKGGQYPDYVMRLVRSGKAHFSAEDVHKQIEVEGNVGYLTHPMDHISYRTNADYWRKADTYTTLTAIEMKKNGVPKNVSTWFLYNIIKPKITFLSLFIRHKGFMDGWYGLVFAYFSALHFPLAYKKFIKL
jgi:glycosyltransferase involved in cell wall biosynthesis